MLRLLMGRGFRFEEAVLEGGVLLFLVLNDLMILGVVIVFFLTFMKCNLL